jgi:drug/metabolite transporter (DMT)-like permease
MLPAFLTALLFSFSIIFAARSAGLLGGATANLGRMVVAVLLLGAWAFSVGKGVSGPGFAWFFCSGIIGFGFGDLALFLALPRIGPRLTILLAQCLAAPFGAVIEWVWLSVRLSGAQMLCGSIIIIAGVVVALAPRRLQKSPPAVVAGTVWGILAALGQAIGAVFSRKGNALAEQAGMPMDGGTAAFQRMLGGIIVAALFYAAVIYFRRGQRPAAASPHAWHWVFLNAVAGPTLGVGCYQWALAGTPSGIVLPIVATAPVLTMPLVWLIDGERPTLRAILGGIIAVGGAVALSLVKNS